MSSPQKVTAGKVSSTVDLRRKAEKQWNTQRQKEHETSMTKADLLHILHELEVHQIELEMQQDELARSHAELEVLLNQYSELYDFAPVGYFSLTQDGTIKRINLTGARLLGSERSKLINRRFGQFVANENRLRFSHFLQKMFSTGQGQERCEILLQADDSAEPHWAQIEATPPDQTSECKLVVIDITDRKRAELELRYLSTHDTLTGLFNRGFFEQELTRLEHGRNFPISILVADVDQLKPVNDHAGHAAGDELLKRAAQVLTIAFRVDDIVARIGGDEFAVHLPATNYDVANVLMDRVRQILQEQQTVFPETPLRLSLGVSTAERPASLAKNLKEADENMYRDKQRRDHSAGMRV